MVGAGRRTVKAVVVLVVLTAACAGHSYARLMETHVELLTAMAQKGVDLVASGHLTAESMPELTYPLERAQAFATAETARRGGAAPTSLAAFGVLVERYREFVDALDRVRRERSGEEARTALAPPLGAVDAAADGVRRALAAERS